MCTSPVRGHLLKTHLEEDIPQLRADLVEGVQSTGWLGGSQSLEVVGLEGGCLPRATCDHLGCQVGRLIGHYECELGALVDLETDDLLHPDKLAFLQIDERLGVGMCPGLLDGCQLVPRNIGY